MPRAPTPTRDQPSSLARARLLERAVQHLLQHSFADGSLRALAAQLGTSHRMLIYHFGSAEGFWEAVLHDLQARDQRALAQATEGGRLPALEETWARLVTAPSLSIFCALFQLYGEALKDRERYAAFLSQFVDSWLKEIAAALRRHTGMSRGEAMLEARLTLAVVRGLVLDLITTGDLKGTTAALHEYARRARKDRQE